MTETERQQRRAAIRRYFATEKGNAARLRATQAYRKRHPERVKVAMVKAQQVFRQRHPERWRAHYAVSKALRSGQLVRSVICEVCLLPAKVQAHHHLGYGLEHWLDVRWLCRSCHLGEHRREA